MVAVTSAGEPGRGCRTGLPSLLQTPIAIEGRDKRRAGDGAERT